MSHLATKAMLMVLSLMLWTTVVYGQYEKAWSRKASVVAADNTNTVSASEHKSVKYSSTIKLMNLPPIDSPDVSVAPGIDQTQSENSIAVSPLNPNIVLNSNNSSNYPVSTIYGASGFTSTDGGLTWYGSTGGTGGTNQGDPAVGIAYSGRFHNGYISNSGQGAAYSTNNGSTWTHVQIYPNPGSLADKNHLWVDNYASSPYVNNVYSAWTDFGGTHNNQIMVSRSTNGGVSWLAAVEVSAAIAAGSHNQGVNIQTGPNGEVYVCWAVYDAWPAAETAIGFAKSTDGGATFSTAQRVITNIKGIRSQATGGGLLGGKDMRTASFPSMTVNMQNGHVYVTWANIGVPGTNTGTERDVWVAKSTDGGTTFGTAVRVNQDTFNNGKDQWFPWIACDPVGGALVCAFYDSRDFTSNDQANTYVAVSRDGGATWEDFRVSDASWNGDGSGTGFSSNYAGDYIGIAVRAGKVYPVWTDRRDAGRLNTWVSPFLLSDPTDPNPVTGVTAYSDYYTPTSMDLTWNDPTTFSNGDPLDTFVVDVYLSGVLKGTVPKGMESFTGTGLTTYNQYSYDLYVRAIPSDSLSSLTSSAPWYAGGHPVPEEPTGIGVVGGPVSGTVSWTNPTLMLDGTPIHDLQYIYVYRNGVELDSVSQGVPTTQYMDTPPDGGFYTYTLKAKLSTGYMSALSDEATAYIGPAPDIEVTPDTLTFAVVTNGLDSGYYSIHNTGQDTLEITGIEGEEINPTAAFVPLFEQAQKYTPDYPKGSMEPTYGDQTDGKGGPDPFGYKWIDSDEPGGPVYNWFDISSIGTQITTWLGTADDGRAKVLLPFAFPFYGNSYSHVWVGTNGFLSFADTITTSYLTNAAIPSAALPNNIIAGMWDDLNATGMAVRYYDDAANGRFVVQYNVVRYGTTSNYVFQILLYTSGKVVVQYNQMDGTRLNEATVGIENSDGTQGLQVVYNANYVHNSLAVQFSRGALWLSQTPSTGSIPPGDSLQVKANVNATGLLGGTYYAKAMIDNNVPLLGPYAHPIFKMTVTGVPDIGVSPSSLDFGEVFVNYPDTLSFRVTNTGSDVLHVMNMYTGTSEYNVVGPTSFNVGVGLYQDVKVVFESAYQGIYTDTVTILSDGNSGTKQVALMAEAVSIPAISVAPDSLYFDLLTNQVDSASYVIRNTGSGTLVVSSIEAEEINASLAPWTQEQKYSPEYPKGAMEPVLGEVTDGRGGPDPFGYKWIDSDEPGGPAFNWVDISSVGTLVTGWLGSTGSANDDDGYVTVALPFGFTYYGATVNSIRIVTNGWISLDAASTNTAYSNVAIPVAAEPNQALYPFWDDMDLDPALGGTVYYYHDAANNRFIVQYTNVPHYSGTTGTYTFQVMLYPSGKIVYQYLSMLQTVNSATIGMENSDGTMGLQVVYNANYMHDNLAIVLSRGATWMTQDQTGGVIAPGDSLVVKVNVDAAGLTGNTYRAKVVIASNDPDHPTTEKPIVSLHVIGVADIGVSPSSLDFGTHFINTTDTLSYTVSNTGTDQLNVTGMSHTAPQFTLLGPTTFSLGVGQSQVVPVVFSSSAVGVFHDTVTITSNGASGTKMVAFLGEAIAPPVIEVDTLMTLGAINEGEEDSTTMWIYNRGYSNLTYSIAEGEDMFTALGFGQPNTSRVRINPLKPVLNQVKRSAGSEEGVTSTAAAEVTGDLRTPTASTMAQFDLQFAYDATAVTGAAGNAAAVYANGEFWTSRWASNILHRWNPDGTLIEQFTVTGVTGTRGLTWDGQYLYAGINTAVIQVIDQASKTLVGTITTSGAGSVRFIAYDPVRDGFWVGNFTGNIFCVNRSGSVIATITTALAGKYGAAYDGFSEGGPYLWVWDQGGGDGTPQLVYQFNLNTLTATGLQFDVASISAIGPGIAGGLFITDELVPGKATLGGMLQGGVGNTDKLWGLELASTGLVWLDVSPSEGTIAAGDSAEITLYMHGIVPAQIVVPVSGYLGIASNDPDDPMVNVHVTMDIVVGVDDQNTVNALPTKYALHANYPNPFNPTTTIKYDLKEAGAVSLKVYNILGQEVRTLVNARETAGFKVATWDGRNNAGQTVASGLYIYRLETEKFTKSRKMMMLK